MKKLIKIVGLVIAKVTILFWMFFIGWQIINVLSDFDANVTWQALVILGLLVFWYCYYETFSRWYTYLTNKIKELEEV